MPAAKDNLWKLGEFCNHKVTRTTKQKNGLEDGNIKKDIKKVAREEWYICRVEFRSDRKWPYKIR